jgi:tetratricopeptide (TPR) repeat protein
VAGIACALLATLLLAAPPARADGCSCPMPDTLPTHDKRFMPPPRALFEVQTGGKDAEARQIIDKGLADNPESIPLTITSAALYIKAGRNQDALRLLEPVAATLDPVYTKIMAHQLDLDQVLSNKDDIGWMQFARGASNKMLALSYYQLRRWEDSKQRFLLMERESAQLGGRMSPPSETDLVRLGDDYLWTGEPRTARDIYIRVEKAAGQKFAQAEASDKAHLQDAYERAQYKLVMVNFRLGEIDAAQGWLRQLVQHTDRLEYWKDRMNRDPDYAEIRATPAFAQIVDAAE